MKYLAITIEQYQTASSNEVTLSLLAFQNLSRQWQALIQKKMIRVQIAQAIRVGCLVFIDLDPSYQEKEKIKFTHLEIFDLLFYIQNHQNTQPLPSQLFKLSAEGTDYEDKPINLKDFALERQLINLLKEAALINDSQIELAMNEQQHSSDLSLGEIFVKRGWIQKETLEFFINKWFLSPHQKPNQAIGYYLKEAGLLHKYQVEEILLEQLSKPVKFGELAVKKQWLKPQTLDFFLKYASH